MHDPVADDGDVLHAGDGPLLRVREERHDLDEGGAGVLDGLGRSILGRGRRISLQRGWWESGGRREYRDGGAAEDVGGDDARRVTIPDVVDETCKPRVSVVHRGAT